MTEESRLVIGMLLAYHYAWDSPYYPPQHNRLAELAVDHGLLHPQVPRTDRNWHDPLEPACLTASGQRCVAAFKNGSWNRVLDELAVRGKPTELEAIIEAVCAREGNVAQASFSAQSLS